MRVQRYNQTCGASQSRKQRKDDSDNQLGDRGGPSGNVTEPCRPTGDVGSTQDRRRQDLLRNQRGIMMRFHDHVMRTAQQKNHNFGVLQFT
jgi:hypothetical protein